MRSPLLTPMLVQYLVGLCCLKSHRNAVDVILGDMVLDEAADKRRDVDVTVTIENDGHITHAFKGFEVKHEGKPLDVASVEQLCLKFSDMPSITHKSIVSSSGYTSAAIKKAARHSVTLYELKQWTRPLKDQFPALGMVFRPDQAFRFSKKLLYWNNWDFGVIAPSSRGPFSTKLSDPVFSRSGEAHSKFSNVDSFIGDLLSRSTDRLLGVGIVQDYLKRSSDAAPSPINGYLDCALPFAHTIDVSKDEIAVDTGSGKHLLAEVTISGDLKWRVIDANTQYYVIENIATSEPLSGSIIIPWEEEGRMTALVFSPDTRDFHIEFVRLDEKHLRAIRELSLLVGRTDES